MIDHANTNHTKAVLAILISDNFKLTDISNDKQGHFQNKSANQEDKIITEKICWTHSILKSRDITLPTMVCLVKAMVFPGVMYRYESWTIKKAVCDELMLLNCGVGELLRVLWTARRPNLSSLKEISPKYLLKGLMLKLKLHYLATWCEERTHWKRPWCWERLKAGGEGDNREWDGCMASLTR